MSWGGERRMSLLARRWRVPFFGRLAIPRTAQHRICPLVEAAITPGATRAHPAGRPGRAPCRSRPGLYNDSRVRTGCASLKMPRKVNGRELGRPDGRNHRRPGFRSAFHANKNITSAERRAASCLPTKTKHAAANCGACQGGAASTATSWDGMDVTPSRAAQAQHDGHRRLPSDLGNCLIWPRSLRGRRPSLARRYFAGPSTGPLGCEPAGSRDYSQSNWHMFQGVAAGRARYAIMVFIQRDARGPASASAVPLPGRYTCFTLFRQLGQQGRGISAPPSNIGERTVQPAHVSRPWADGETSDRVLAAMPVRAGRGARGR